MAKAQSIGSVKISPQMLRRTARLMIPFYRQIAGNRSYALRWSQAVRTGNIQAACGAGGGHDQLVHQRDRLFRGCAVPEAGLPIY